MCGGDIVVSLSGITPTKLTRFETGRKDMDLFTTFPSGRMKPLTFLFWWSEFLMPSN